MIQKDLICKIEQITQFDVCG